MATSLIIVSVIITLIAGYIFFAIRRMKNVPDVPKSDKIKDLTDKNFQHQVKNTISLIDFWASWCVPCKMMSPVLNELAEEVGVGVQVCKVNVEEYQSLASKYAVRGIPTMILLKDGKEVNRFVGVKSKEFLLDQIQKVR